MGLRTERQATRWLRSIGLAAAAGILVAACGSASAGASATPTSPPAATPSPIVESTPAPVATKGPPSDQISITGNAAAAALTQKMTVQCNMPSLSGSQIVLYHQDAAGLAVRIVLSAGSVNVRYASGSGKTYLERDFAGTGVTGFDGSKGATIDSQLETAPNPGATGTLGAIAAIKGSVDCGDQTAGTSTLTLTGATVPGQLNGLTLGPVRVQCQTVGQVNYVQLIGIGQIGTTPAVIFVGGGSDGRLYVTLEPQGGKVDSYNGITPGVVTISAGGMHVSGDTPEQLPAGSKDKPRKVTVSGDATCGIDAGG